MAKISYTPAIKAELEEKWATLTIDKDRPGITAVAKKLLSLKPRYQTVSDKTGVPWWFIAVCHQREASADFKRVLHNGEAIVGENRATRLVPKGRGPFATWEEAAIDALSVPPHKLDSNKDWSVGRVLYEIEKFNGFGYRMKGKPSPYLFSHTCHYKDSPSDDDPAGGKYVADGKYREDVFDAQYGAAAVLKVMTELDKDIRFSGQTQASPSTSSSLPHPAKVVKPVVGLGTALLAWLTLGVKYAVAGAVLAGVAYGIYKALQWRKQRAQPQVLPTNTDPSPETEASKEGQKPAEPSSPSEPSPERTELLPTGPDPQPEVQVEVSPEQLVVQGDDSESRADPQEDDKRGEDKKSN